ncbi:MAG: bifunctional DNA primase/polymerase [Desulfobacca sp.]|nr:bifunctional DNA primase/polymerase [Desulfobacca sp.]
MPQDTDHVNDFLGKNRLKSESISEKVKYLNLLTPALDYARRGWPVIPLWWVTEDGRCACGNPECGNPGKHPLGKLVLHGVHDATTDQAIIREWWTQYPEANIGVATGQASGLVVLDIDPRNGGDIKKLPGNLPLTPTVATGGGGQHYYLRHPGDSVKNAGGLAGYAGVDFKADGGCVVAPPSNHNSGRQYSWDYRPETTPLSSIPDWLLRLIQTPPAQQSQAQALTDGQPILDGQRNLTLTSLAGTMRRRGFGEAAIRAALEVENRARCQPPLDDAEVARIARSVMRYRPNAPTPVLVPAPVKDPIPELPAQVIGGVAGRYAETYSQYLECCKSFLFFSYLTILGNLISGTITLKTELRPQPRLYTVLLGESADDRKSTAISKTISLFRQTIQPDQFNLIYGVGSGEGLAKALGKTEEMSRAILVQDELKTLVQKCKIEASILLPAVNTLFEENFFRSVTLKRSIDLNDAHLSLLAASTLDTYKNMFTPQFLDIGFINRLFIVIGNSERKYAIPAVIPETVKAGLTADIGATLKFVDGLAGSCGGLYEMPLTSAASDIFEAWYLGQERSPSAKRLDTYGHRLMVLLAINEHLDVVTPEIADQTVALLNYELAARRYADPIDADNAGAKIEETIRRLLTNGPLRKRDLEKRGHKHRVGVWLWNQAVKNLLAEKDLSYNPQEKIYWLNVN